VLHSIVSIPHTNNAVQCNTTGARWQDAAAAATAARDAALADTTVATAAAARAVEDAARQTAAATTAAALAAENKRKLRSAVAAQSKCDTVSGASGILMLHVCLFILVKHARTQYTFKKHLRTNILVLTNNMLTNNVCTANMLTQTTNMRLFLQRINELTSSLMAVKAAHKGCASSLAAATARGDAVATALGAADTALAAAATQRTQLSLCVEKVEKELIITKGAVAEGTKRVATITKARGATSALLTKELDAHKRTVASLDGLKSKLAGNIDAHAQTKRMLKQTQATLAAAEETVAAAESSAAEAIERAKESSAGAAADAAMRIATADAAVAEATERAAAAATTLDTHRTLAADATAQAAAAAVASARELDGALTTARGDADAAKRFSDQVTARLEAATQALAAARCDIDEVGVNTHAYYLTIFIYLTIIIYLAFATTHLRVISFLSYFRSFFLRMFP
jgi:hypothetical protein